MRYLLLLSFIFVSNFAFGQTNFVKDGNLTIRINEARFHFMYLGDHKHKFSKDGETVEILADLLVRVEIDGFDEKNTIDFNNFSLVEHEYKLRQRPYYIWFNGYFLKKYKVGEEILPDNFLAYSQVDKGIEDYDHYYNENLIFEIDKVYRQRFYPLCLERKKNKKKLFLLTIPVKIQNKGDFSLYYKNQLVCSFSATRKWKKF